MYIKSVNAMTRGLAEDPIESWNEIVFEARIGTKMYQYLMVLDIGYLSEHADEVLEHVQFQFAKKRQELKQ